MKQQLLSLYHSSRKFTKKHATTILTVIEIAGVAWTMYETARATMKIKDDIENLEAESEEMPDTKDKIKATWKHGIRPGIAFATTTTTIVLNDRLNAKQKNAWKALATMATKSADDIIEKTIEKTSDKKLREIKEAVYEKTVNDADIADGQIYDTGYGDTLFYDRSCNTLFKSDYNDVRRAINDIVDEMHNDPRGAVSFNTWYDALNLPQTDIGDDLGFCLDIDGRFDKDIIELSPIIDNRGRTVVMISYARHPQNIWFSN